MPVGTAQPLALPLRSAIPCRASEGAPAHRHPIVVRPDWSIDTGHDEELERIAAALGGGASCLRELRSMVPALRLWWERATRRAGLVIRSDDQGPVWRAIDGVRGCCPRAGFADPLAAAAHARDVGHVAAVARVDRVRLRRLVAAIEGPTDPPPPPTSDGRPLSAVAAAAWACGLHPGCLARFAEALPLHDGAEALAVLLALAQTAADPTWVRTSAAEELLRLPERDPDGLHAHLVGLLVWLAWTMTDLDREQPTARTSWLATGARRSDIVALSLAGYTADAAREIAEGWGITLPGAAQLLARWVERGLRPRPVELVDLRDSGLAFGPAPPAPAAVHRVADLLGIGGSDPATNTVIALAIARAGTVTGALLALQGTGIAVRSA
jgi:hypothetical protein